MAATASARNHRHKHRRRRRKMPLFLKRLLTLAAVFLIWWLNNYTLKTVHTSLHSPKINDSFRAVVISDQHTTKDGISNEAIISRVESAKPDVIFVLGDMYSRNSEWELIKRPIELMSDITADGFPVYFVPGDHDTSKNYLAALKSARVHVMDYKSEKTDIKGTPVQIMGIDNVYYSPTFDLSKEFSNDPGRFNILLAHIPNYNAFAAFGADLTLSADTHGDMTRLPFIGPVYDRTSQTFFPKLHNNELYDKGWFSYDGGKLFITSGIGVSPAPIRFWNRPEIVVIDFKHDD